MPKNKQKFVSGFVSILGRPNVGKSTLLNQFVGTKISIVSDKPQTTRASIQGVLNKPGAQVVFLDTPGIHRPDTLINKKLAHDVAAALEGRDLLLLVVDCTKPVTLDDERAVERVARTGTPALLLLNKIDLRKDKSRMLPLIVQYGKLAKFEEFIPISALRGEGLEQVEAAIVSRMPEGPLYFPEDQITDQPARFLVSELVREKVLRLTRQEVPYSVVIQIDSWEETDRLLRVVASIVVERTGQKVIVLGKKGSRLKQIGTEAREEAERIVGKRMYLELFVKVRKNWREKPAFLGNIDWKS